MTIAEIKRNGRAWLSGRPRLLQAVFRVVGKPYTEIAIFRSIVRPGDTVLDLGANTGQYTCLFCVLVGTNGSVHAFEPIPPTFATLEKNAARYSNECHLVLNDLAAGDAEETMTMFVSDGRFTEASLVAHGVPADHHLANFECRVTTVDHYISQKNIKEVALIKCDVEGAELLAMKGAASLLRNAHPPILFLEAWSDWTVDFGYRPSELFEFLEREAGYAIYHVGKGVVRRISPAETLPPDAFPDFLNFLCIAPSVHGDRLRSLERAGIAIIEK